MLLYRPIKPGSPRIRIGSSLGGDGHGYAAFPPRPGMRRTGVDRLAMTRGVQTAEDQSEVALGEVRYGIDHRTLGQRFDEGGQAVACRTQFRIERVVEI